jgi:hypothetical protein
VEFYYFNCLFIVVVSVDGNKILLDILITTGCLHTIWILIWSSINGGYFNENTRTKSQKVIIFYRRRENLKSHISSCTLLRYWAFLVPHPPQDHKPHLVPTAISNWTSDSPQPLQSPALYFSDSLHLSGSLSCVVCGSYLVTDQECW